MLRSRPPKPTQGASERQVECQHPWIPWMLKGYKLQCPIRCEQREDAHSRKNRRIFDQLRQQRDAAI